MSRVRENRTHGSMRRGLETEHPAMVKQRSGPQGKPGEKWLRDLTPDNATAPAPDPTSGVVAGSERDCQLDLAVQDDLSGVRGGQC